MPNPLYTKFVKTGTISDQEVINKIIPTKEDDTKKAISAMIVAERLLYMLGCDKEKAMNIIEIVYSDPNFPNKLD